MTMTERQSLARFEAENSPEGLLRRYARGRVRHFVPRQIATVAGSLALALLVSLDVAFLAAGLALLGEFIDCAVLYRVPALLDRKVPMRRLYLLSALTAGFQAITIAATVLIAQWTALTGEASLFSFAFLAAAVLNAGVVQRYHPLATNIRNTIYGLTAIAGFGVEMLNGESGEGLVYNAFGLAMLAFIAYVFLRFVDGADRRRFEDSRNLLVGQEALERAIEELRVSQAEARQLALVARHANDAVMLLDSDHRILWVNEGFTRMKGYTPEEVLGQTPTEVLAAPGSDRGQLEDVARTTIAGQSVRYEILNRTKDGREIWVEAAFAPILTPDGGVEKVIVIERDITEAKLRAQELAEARDRAEAGARAKAAFLATMSHEIRTPMNGIIGMSDLLAEEPLSDQQKLYARTMRNSAEALLKIINDILDYSKLEADKLPIVAEPFSLADCIRDAAGILKPQAREKGLFLDICHETPLPALVIGDSGRLRQILINLLANAIKFTSSGGVTVTSRVTPGDAFVDIAVKVADTGIGVAPEGAGRIFERFEQADAETTREHGGTGLGLAISRQLARRMGGDLRLLPPDGPGAAFELTLRLARVDVGAEEAPEPSVQEAESVGPMRLLLVEDNATNRLLVQRYLEGEGIEVTEAEDGGVAVDLAQRLAPDVILMDMSMPVLDGLEATRRIRAAGGPRPWIIALTANAFDSDREACLAAGMDDFLAKPLRKTALLTALAHIPRQGEGEKALGSSAPDGVSGPPTSSDEAPTWKSRQESGTTSGRSTRSSAR